MTSPLDLPESAEQAILEATQIIRDHGRNLSENGWTGTGIDLIDQAIAIERAVLRRPTPSEPLKEEMQKPNTSHLIASEASRLQEDAPSSDAVLVRTLLWGEHLECCGNPVVGGTYMGQQEQVCCGNPEPALLNDAQIVATLRARFPNV